MTYWPYVNANYVSPNMIELNNTDPTQGILSVPDCIEKTFSDSVSNLSQSVATALHSNSYILVFLV